VQFGFTNSHPDFTSGGDYLWSNAPDQADDIPLLADDVIRRPRFHKLAVVFINCGWGRTNKAFLVRAATERGRDCCGRVYLPRNGISARHWRVCPRK
jgi:branched-chain amino acid transport system substrate-binding protein